MGRVEVPRELPAPGFQRVQDRLVGRAGAVLIEVEPAGVRLEPLLHGLHELQTILHHVLGCEDLDLSSK